MNPWDEPKFFALVELFPTSRNPYSLCKCGFGINWHCLKQIHVQLHVCIDTVQHQTFVQWEQVRVWMTKHNSSLQHTPAKG